LSTIVTPRATGKEAKDADEVEEAEERTKLSLLYVSSAGTI
jgi:hypothetical protein